jgi:hypothetical protein
MHEGDPSGQLRPSRIGEAMCSECHTIDARAHPDALPHAEVPCTGCHMPAIVYGLRGVHVSHRIDVPRAAVLEPGARPDACVLCHADLDAARAQGPPRDGALPRLLLGGDPVQRAVAAVALGGEVRGADESVVRAWLAEAVRSDPYPAVRAIAWASLRARATDTIGAHELDAAGPRVGRERALEALAGRLGPLAPLDPAWLAERVARRSEAVIEIGE